MRQQERVTADKDTAVEYHQFTQSRALRGAIAIVGILTWPLVVPLALLARLSDFVFLACSQLLALVPYLPGTIVRYEFYRFTLRRCGRNVMVGFGTFFLYRDIEIGSDVLIGAYNTIHHCDFGSHVLTAEGCRFLSGPHYHTFERTDVPMALQGGRLRRVLIADDCWIGANAVVMANVGNGSVVAAGAVVTETVAPWSIVGGVPARLLRSRRAS